MNNDYLDYLEHYGVKGMKWGVRKDYTPTGIRARIAKAKNDKVDAGFNKWKEGATARDNAIELGKVKNEKKLAYATNKSKETRREYRESNSAYKKALRKNTTYRKGTVRQDVGRDMAKKYMTEAKRLKKQEGFDTNKKLQKQYGKLMSKHDIERAKARDAQAVGAARSSRIASMKRNATITVKTATKTAAFAGGVYAANAVLNKKNISFEPNRENIDRLVNFGRVFSRYMY